MKNTKRLYADIAKVTQQDDGTIIVSGFASTGSVDSDGETITAEAMKSALPDYMKFGAVREMHQPSAAGTATRAEVNSEGQTEFEALIVDPLAVKKVQTGVYKGFSIGGKVTERDTADKNIIKGLKLVEVSLVDRPANPEAMINVFKAERTPEDDVTELAEMLDAGTVTPAQVLELVKAAKAPEPVEPKVEAPEEAPKVDEVKKGLYGVSQFAQVLQSIGYLASDAQCEAEWESDNSPIPAQLRDWLAQGAALLQAMTAEEAAELVASLSTQAGDVDVIEQAAKAADLAKSGAKFSADTKKQLGDIHKAMQDAHAGMGDLVDKMASVGFADDAADAPKNDGKQADDEGKKAAEVEDLRKAELAYEDLVKAIVAVGCPEDETMSEWVEKTAKLAAEVEPLRKRIKELEAMPAPGKALLKIISKSEDTGPANAAPVAEDEPIRKANGTIDHEATAMAMMRKIHSAGGRSVIR